MKTLLWLLPAISLITSLEFFYGHLAKAQVQVQAKAQVQAQVKTQVKTQVLSQPRQAELTELVRQDCGSCHGMTLNGGLGKGLLPSDLKESTVSDLTEIILEGVAGTPMPGWRGLLSDAEAKWIAMHLKSGSIKRGNQ